MIGPTWLIDDVLRVEKLLIDTAGASAHPLVSEPSLHLLKAGGKRLRPALVLVTSRAGRPGRRSTDLGAAAIELVHLATLYHDDVIDGTDTRRGVPTTHAKWGTEVAVLTGDYLFACGCGLGAEAGGEVPRILARAIARVCEGQIVETASLDDPSRSIDDYLGTISAKTASLFRAACEVGTFTSGATEHWRGSLLVYGEQLGLVFQIVDDLLDIVGDPLITGKTPGTDVKDGVFTAPVLFAAQRQPHLRRRLEAGDRDVDDLLPVIVDGGGVTDGYHLARRYAEGARQALSELPSSGWRSALEDIVQGVLAQVPEAAVTR